MLLLNKNAMIKFKSVATINVDYGILFLSWNSYNLLIN